MEIEVKGHSGCSIDIVRQGKDLFVLKGTKDVKYIERLYRQAAKQEKASRRKYQFIRIPSIIDVRKTDSEMVMQMEYVYAKNFIDYFENAGFEQVDYFVKAIDIFLDSEIRNSKIQQISADVVKDKFLDVKHKVESNADINNDSVIKDIMKRSGAIFANMPDEIELPIGECHGDLTFSNILFNGNNYYLIDFLDSFVESPLLDMVKLRQDTCFKWSVQMYTGSFDATRFDIVCAKIDEELDRIFSSCEWYKKYYYPFQLMNFLRVLQYAHDPKVICYLKNVLIKILSNE